MFKERASIYEYDAGFDKKQSEIKAFDDCIIKWLEVNKSDDVDSAIQYLLSCGLHNPFYIKQY